MDGDYIAVAIRRNGQTFAALWTSAGITLRCDENLVQQHDRQVAERAERERIARDARWRDPTYLVGDPGVTWGG